MAINGLDAFFVRLKHLSISFVFINLHMHPPPPAMPGLSKLSRRSKFGSLNSNKIMLSQLRHLLGDGEVMEENSDGDGQSSLSSQMLILPIATAVVLGFFIVALIYL
jgi:hypothetical protein